MATIDERARDAIRDAKAAYEVAQAKHKAAHAAFVAARDAARFAENELRAALAGAFRARPSLVFPFRVSWRLRG